VRYEWLLVATAVGCGDNSAPIGEPLVHARDLTIVAHTEDDLVFMQPDVYERTRRGGVTNLYLTGGNSSGNRGQLGLLAAYSAITGANGWQCGWLAIHGHSVEHCRLEQAHLSLIFFGYPEGGVDGSAPDSLLHLWDGTINSTSTIGDVTTRFERDDLIATVTATIDETQPKTIRTLDIGGTHGDDSSDHVITGALALAATAASATNPELVAFRADNTALEPVNVVEPVFARSASILAFYDACTTDCAACGQPCTDVTPIHATSLHRRYAVATRRTGAGELRSEGQCAGANTDGSMTLGDCTAPQHWELAADGTLRVDNRCLEILPTGELAAGDNCEPDAAHRFFLDDEGHVWLGTPPLAEPGKPGSVACLGVSGGRPRGGRCGPTAPIWELAPAPTATPRPQGLTSTGRAVRLADLDGDHHADLCAVEAGKLECAIGDGMGGFAATIVIHALAVEPESLVIGDVDGDGMPDACGRDSAGILCATTAAGFVPQRWSPEFAHTGPANATDRSLGAVDSDGDGSAELCGLTLGGVVCATHDLTGLPPIRSTWPDGNAALWPGDLDGDRHADWCVATAGAGVACGLDAQSSLTTDGVPWSFSLGGEIEPPPASTAIGALADFDGDGRADMCMVWTRRVVCARSQSYGFGPSTTLADLPGSPALTVLWLGDLDGDGAADACTDDAGTIRCIRSR